jgi:RNA polymerase sigma-70 factor, ECF subfamily
MARISEDEECLIAGCKAGDAACYAELVRLHEDAVFNTAYRLLGNYEEARDAAQETFLNAHRALGRFRGDCRLSTWLYRIALNTARSMRRKKVAARSVSFGYPADCGPELQASPATDPWERASATEQSELALKALARMDEEQREILVLHEMEGLGYAEMADVLDCPVGTIKSKLHRARLALREAALRAAGEAMHDVDGRGGKGMGLR